jgi:dienelactone hydrolase
MKLSVVAAACCLMPLAAAENPGGKSFEQLSRLYDYDRKAPLDLKESGVSTRDGIQVHDISYASPLGGRVTASLFVPPGKGPFAGMVFMHGGGGVRGQMAPAATMFAKTGAVCLTLDAPYSGGRAIAGQELQDWLHPERTRDGFIQTVVDMRRGVDVLLARPDVDPKRLGYYGGSFGALTGGVLAGVEHRIKAYVLMSSPASINDAQIPRVMKPLTTMPKEEAERSRAIIETVAPVYYVGHAAPSALFFQIGNKDLGIPRESADRLHKAASEPKLIRWYDGDHGLSNQAKLDSAEWLRKEIGLGPLDAADRQRLEATARK